MDFALNEDQEAIKQLAKQILRDKITEESLRELEESDGSLHKAAWKALVESQLLGIAIPESAGGGGMTELELSLVLQQIGRNVAPVPVLSSILSAAMPIAQHGGEEAVALVREMLTGKRLLTAALYEAGGTNLQNPLATATKAGDSYKLNGTKTNVAAFADASHMVVNARLDSGTPALFVVPLDADGVTVETQRQTNFEVTGHVTLSDVTVDDAYRIGDDHNADELFAYLEQRILLGQASIMLGVAEQALFLTAEYSTKREQFGKPIGTFQAVSQRAGDAFIDVASIRLMVWKAAFELSNGIDASRSCRVAAYWAAEGGHRVVAAAQHIHGGMGFDCDYPLHRFFLTMKSLEFALGGARAQLETFGTELATAVAS